MHEWDESVPNQCTFGISLIVYNDQKHIADVDWVMENMVPVVGQLVSNEFDTVVYYHRTWRGQGKNITRDQEYHPRMT